MRRTKCSLAPPRRGEGQVSGCLQPHAPLPFSRCGRRWREAPDEGSLSAYSLLLVCSRMQTPHPNEFVSATELPSPTRGEGTIRSTALSREEVSRPQQFKEDPP